MVALVAWATLVLVSRFWGLEVERDAPEPIFVDAVPFYGVWRLELGLPLLLATLVLAAATWLLPVVADRWGWRALLGGVAVGAVAVSLALAVVEPPPDTWRNVEGDYGRFTSFVDEKGPGGFLRDYAEDQLSYPTHLSAHPPGMTMLLWAGEKVGLGSTGGQIATVMLGVAAAAIAVLVSARELVGEDFARRAAPFVVVAPAAVWHTNADVVFGGIVLSGLALLVVACGRTRRASLWRAVVGGGLLGLGLLFSQGMALMALPAAAVVLHTRRWRAGLLAAAAAVAVVLLPLLWGYWWVDSLASTKEVYDQNLARVRPYGYFLVANLAAFAVAVGPASALALTRLRGRAPWVLVGGGLAAVAVADLSGMSLAETERIWQPFMPLVLVGCGALVAGRAVRARGWLAMQAVVALVLVAWLRSPW